MYLLSLFEALRGVAEEADDPLDRLLHAIELVEGRIDPDGPVHEDPAESGVFRRVHHLGFADGGQQPLGRGRIAHRIGAAGFQKLRQTEFDLAVGVEATRIGGKDVLDRIKHRSLHC